MRSVELNPGAAVRIDPLEVRPRWLVYAGFMAALVVSIAALVALRRSDLDFDDDLLAGAVLALSFWIFALGLGGLLRNLSAGYALRLDGAGLHVPGLEIVPWSAIHAARLHTYESGGKRFRQLVVDVDPDYSGASARHYERFLFGPVTGLLGKRGTLAIPVQLLAIDGDSLLATTRAYIDAVEGRAGMSADGANLARQRGLSGRRLP